MAFLYDEPLPGFYFFKHAMILKLNHLNFARHVCKWCGKDYLQGKCLAVWATCFTCNHKGHFKSWHSKKTVVEIVPDSGLHVVTEHWDGLVGAVYYERTSSRMTNIVLNGLATAFKTGHRGKANCHSLTSVWMAWGNQAPVNHQIVTWSHPLTFETFGTIPCYPCLGPDGHVTDCT